MRVNTLVISVFTMLVLVFVSTSVVLAQEPMPSAPPTGGEDERTVFACIVAKCVSSGNEYVVSGSGNSLPEAEADAVHNCSIQHCGGGAAVKVVRPVDPDDCVRLAAETARSSDANPSAAIASGLWLVEATLHYRDGTILGNVKSRGENRCAAIAASQRNACRLKDKCRPACCITYRVLERPCCPCGN